MDFNFTSQICTTEEQSKRLLALGLKRETADMVILEHPRKEGRYFYIAKEDANWDGFPAWSLHRLIQIVNAMFDENAENPYDDIIATIQSFIHLGCLNEKYLNMNIVNARENVNIKLLKNEKSY